MFSVAQSNLVVPAGGMTVPFTEYKQIYKSVFKFRWCCMASETNLKVITRMRCDFHCHWL